jgi:hypothetical protein
MLQGTMIDELIQSVERAEQRVREQQQKEAAQIVMLRFPLLMANWRQVIEVA